MARRGMVMPEVARLVRAAREQWGKDSVVESGPGRFKIKPPHAEGERGLVIVLSGKSKARGAANARAQLRRAGLRV